MIYLIIVGFASLLHILFKLCYVLTNILIDIKKTLWYLISVLYTKNVSLFVINTRASV